MNFGLLEIIRDARDYIMGEQFKLPRVPYCEDGNWEPHLPKYEPQAENYETQGCTVWGSQNQIETFEKRVYRKEPNYSERFTYNRVPVDPNRGADPKDTYQCIRQDGLIDNDLLQVPPTLAEFLDKSKITGSLLAKGQNWLKYNDFMYEWLWPSRPANALEIMKDMLQYSPLGVAVTAWYMDGSGKYVDMGQRNNHWCMCYRIDDEGIHIFDSYDHSKKVLSLDHKIGRAVRIWVGKNKKTMLKRHVSLLERILKSLLGNQVLPPTFLDVCEDAIGSDASPADIVPDEVGCAETVSTLMKKVWTDTPIMTGTWTLWDYLSKHPQFQRVTVPTPGCIIISPTVPNKPFPGHTGVFVGNMNIASNDSKTGKFLENYDLETWMARYVTKGGYPAYIYKRNQ